MKTSGVPHGSTMNVFAMVVVFLTCDLQFFHTLKRGLSKKNMNLNYYNLTYACE